MKYVILTFTISSVALLGLTDPEWPQRDPVPASQIVAHSIHCAGCHGYDPSGASLVDEEGNDVNMYDDWRISMMGYSSFDPFWRATLKHEVSLFPDAQVEIETTCLKCHAPLGSQQSQYDGLPYSYEAMLADTLGLDGVSCAACHQQPPETYGTSHSGNITLNSGRIIYGPHPKPFEGPMELYVGFMPTYTDLIYSSGVCAGCHTLITPTLDDDGVPTGNMFVEQATYHEWLNSSYSAQGQECQSCHMPLIEDSVLIATGQQGLQKRSPFGIHQFYGANTAMLTLMQEYRDELNLPGATSDAAWSESIDNNRLTLRNAAEVAVTNSYVLADTLYIDVTVTNKAGHKLPSGYPSRVAWLQVVLVDALNGDTIYENGMMDGEGHITGRDLPYEPHHEYSLSSDDVQIYELAMSDVHGNLTTRLNAASEPFKDNRLLPTGFRRNHSTYDTVAVWGEAIGDADYDAFSTQGQDRIEYRIALNGKKGFADLHVALQYHTFPSRWMQDIFQNEGIEEVSSFKDMYNGYERFTELINRFTVEDLELQPSAVSDIDDSIFTVYPNPVVDGKINLHRGSCDECTYILYDSKGKIFQRGMLSDEILLTDDIASGMYLLSITKRTGEQHLQKVIVMNR